MNKKAYIVPEVEVLYVDENTPLMAISTGGGDPTIHNDDIDPSEPVILE